MQTGKQIRGYLLQRVPNSLQRKLSDPDVQVYSPRILAAANMSLAAVSPRHLDTLIHETRGYKRVSNSHFEKEGERKRPESNFRERNTERNQFP